MDLRPTVKMIRFSRPLLDTQAQFKFQRKYNLPSHRKTTCSVKSSDGEFSALVIKAFEGEEVHFQLFLTEAHNGGELSGLGLGGFTRCETDACPH
jgi:hypothetical protein